MQKVPTLKESAFRDASVLYHDWCFFILVYSVITCLKTE